MNKIITAFMILLLLITAVVYLYWKIPVVQEKMATYTEDDFEQENIYTDLEDISIRLQDEIQKGSDEFTIYLKDLDVKELEQINSLLDGIYGCGSTYQQIRSVGEKYKKVKITIERTINYAAVQAYINHTPILDSDERARILYEKIKEVMDSVITESMSDYEKEIALHDYLVSHCKYSEEVNQYSESDIYRAYGALVNREAVCNGYAEALTLLLECAGVNSMFVTGTAEGIEHAWNLVELDGKWYHLDATWDDPLPDRGESVIHPYLNVTDSIIEKSHTWKREDYPQAWDMEYNYYVQKNAFFYSFSDFQYSAYDRMINGDEHYYEAVVEGYEENQDDMQFIFQNNDKLDNVNWQCFAEGDYRVLVLNGQ